MLCAAGTGAIQPSVGFFGAEDATPQTPFLVFGHVWYGDGSFCSNPAVNITNLNTSAVWQAETRDGYGYYERILNSTDVISGVTLIFNATDDAGVNITNHTVSQSDLERGGIFDFNITFGTEPDIRDLSLADPRCDPEQPMIRDTVNVTTHIINNGIPCTNDTRIIFYNEKNISVFRFYWNFLKSNGIDTITQPGAHKMRIHFIDMGIHGNGSYVRIYNKSNILIDNFTSEYQTDFWTDWSDGDTIKIGSNASDHTHFMIDRYQAVFGDRTASVCAGESVDAVWNASAYLNSEDIASGNHTIRVEIDPENLIDEADESNNNQSIVIAVKSVSIDLEAVDVSINEMPLDGDCVNVTATIANNGVEDTGNFTVRFYDDAAPFFNETLSMSAESSTILHVLWNATFGNHTITAIADPDGEVNELNETNNQANRSVYVSPSKDFEMVDVTFADDDLFSGKCVAVNATVDVTNLLDCGGMFGLGFYFDDTPLDTNSVTFRAGNTTIYTSFDWTVGAAGEHNFTVCADPGNNTVELNETNNNLTVAVNVSKRLDFNATYLNVTPSNPVLRNTLIMDATIANDGTAGGEAIVGFYDDGTTEMRSNGDELEVPGALAIRLHFKNFTLCNWSSNCCIKAYDGNDSLIFNRTVEGIEYCDCITEEDVWTDWGSGDNAYLYSNVQSVHIDRYEVLFATESMYLNAGESKNCSASWPLTFDDARGDHNISVRVDPHDTIDELDETNNQRSTMINVAVGQDFTVTSLNFNETPTLYDDVILNATIENHGRPGGMIKVGFFMDDTRINTTEVYVDAGETNNTEVVWNANTAGNHIIRAMADPDGEITETNEGNNNMSKEIFVNGIDLAVTHIEVPHLLYRRDVTNVTATIVNLGVLDASDFDVAFLSGIGEDNTTGVEFYKTSISHLDAGNSINVSTRWNLTDASLGYNTITVVLGNFSSNIDNDAANDMDHEHAVVLTQWDFSVEEVVVEPDEVKEGGKVDIAATIGNHGHASGNISVGFYVSYNDADNIGIPDIEYIRIGTIDDVYVAVNETNIITMTWNANLSGGWNDVKVVANPDETLEELDYMDNVKNTSLYIIPPDLSLLDVSLKEYPVIGDLIDITATVRNEGGEFANSTVRFFYAGVDKINTSLGNRSVHLDPKSSGDYTVTWNTTPLMPGNYTILVAVENDAHYEQRFLSGTDLAVTEVDLPINNMDGDHVNITATIENLGRKNATDFTVKFWKIYYPEVPVYWMGESLHNVTLIKEINITNFTAGAAKDIPVQWDGPKIQDFSFTGFHYIDGKKYYGTWTETGYNYTVKVEIDPIDNRENNGSNNYKETKIHVNRSRDFSVTYLSFTVGNESCDPSELVAGDNVTLNATIDTINLANRGGTVDVGFYFADEFDPNHPERHLINGTTVTMPFDIGNRTGYAALDWHIGNFDDVTVPGHHNITVVVDPYNETIELNESNNTFRQPTYVKAPDFTVTNITFDPESPEAGEMVNITATVTNLGNKNESEVVVKFIDESFTDGEIHAVEHIIDSPHPVPDYYDHTWAIVHRDAHIMRVHFTKIDIDTGTALYINGNVWRGVNTTNWTTDWINGDAITIRLERASPSPYGQRWGFNIDRYEYMGRMESVQSSLATDDMKLITVMWNATPAGQHNITAIIDPEDVYPEFDESNNTLTRTMIVQGTDLTVSDMRLTINGTEINVTETVIKDGATVNISATVANIGIKPASEFNVGFFVGDIEIGSATISNLTVNESKNVFTTWNATIGDYTITVGADSENRIFETGELNNTISINDVKVRGADLTVRKITFTVLPPEGAATGTTSDAIYDTDNVVINATITNQGIVPADNFTVDMFCSKRKLEDFSCSRGKGDYGNDIIDREWDDAEYIYVHVEVCKDYRIDIHNKSEGLPVYSTTQTGWYLVKGDRVRIYGMLGGSPPHNAMIHFYAGDITKIGNLSLDVGESMNISITQYVSPADDNPTAAIIDPENSVPENSEENNIAFKSMCVHPSRDFTITETRLFHNGSEITVNDTILDGDTVLLDAGIGMGINESDPYREHRKGTVMVECTDYETEYRSYPYYFDKYLSPPYVLTSPDADTIIYRPGVDAIQVHFKWVTLNHEWGRPKGYIEVCDESGESVWSMYNPTPGYAPEPYTIRDKDVLVPGDTVYIRTTDATFRLRGYTTEKKFAETEISLNATENKSITSLWGISTGNHYVNIRADPDDRIVEINESNNESMIPLHVDASRDPAIIELSNYPLHPESGDDVNITATVRNNGSKTANFTLDFWTYTEKRFTTDSECSIYERDAKWIGIRFKSFCELVPDHKGDKFYDRSNFWVDSIGDTIEVAKHEYYDKPTRWSIAGTVTEYPYWYKQIDRIRYKKLLKRVHVSLVPGETDNVTAIWEKMEIESAPTCFATALIDPEDEIDEIDESDNLMEKEIIFNYPDFEVACFNPPTERDDATVTVKNRGIGHVPNVTVEFCRGRREDISKTRDGYSYYTVVPDEDVRKKDPKNMRLHFKELNLKRNDSVVTIKKSLSRSPVATYTEDGEDFWTPWVEGNKVVIEYFTGASFEIDAYEWGDVENNFTDLGAGGRKSLPIPWTEYTEPWNLTVTMDPEDRIHEFDEKNNNKTVLMYVDLVPTKIEFVSPSERFLCTNAEEYIIDATVRNTNTLRKDGIAFPVRNGFNVTLEVSHPNGTIAFNQTEFISETLYAGDEAKVRFISKSVFPAAGYYNVSVIADPSGDVIELGENDNPPTYNNITSVNVSVKFSGYTGGGDLINIAQGEVHGRVVYTTGDSRYGGLTLPGGTETARYTGVVPDDAGDIEFARIFLYWFMYHEDPDRSGYFFIPEIAHVDVAFNGHSLDVVGNYTDTSGVGADYGYGLYSYDVTDYIVSGGGVENVATVRNDAEWKMGVQAIGLLIVYEDEDEPLTKYWINEGADIMMPDNEDYETGIPACSMAACFGGIEREDTEKVNATLLTVLGFFKPHPPRKGHRGGDALLFNKDSIGDIVSTGVGTSHWKHVGSVGFSKRFAESGEWDDVTDQVESGRNIALIESYSNYMMPNNAFLRLIFPPDLNVINLTAPASTVVGAHHSINVTIRNDGRSDAHDFNVTFHIDGKRMVRIPHLDLPAGNSTTIHLYDWTPMMLGHVYNLTAAADVLSGEDWTEVETDNNAMTKRVLIEEGGFGNQTGPRGIGGGSEATGGKFTEKITGRIMQGAKFLTLGGGGGAGMFSLTEWIMKGAVWLMLLFFVCTGYWMEQRSYGRASRWSAGAIISA